MRKPLFAQVDPKRGAVGVHGVVEIFHEEVVGVLGADRAIVAGVGVGAHELLFVVHQGYNGNLPQTGIAEIRTQTHLIIGVSACLLSLKASPSKGKQIKFGFIDVS